MPLNIDKLRYKNRFENWANYATVVAYTIAASMWTYGWFPILKL